MLKKEAYQLCQVIYGEKMREKFEVTIADRVIGMQIFSAQKKIDDYREIFDELVRPNSRFQLDNYIAEEISRTLLRFQSDEH